MHAGVPFPRSERYDFWCGLFRVVNLLSVEPYLTQAIRICYILTDRLSVDVFEVKIIEALIYMRIVKTAEERKEEILDVAEQLFAEKGFDNASTNDIINKIGIARGTLYHHFNSKEEILDAIVDRMISRSIAGARAIIKDTSIPLLDRLSGAFLSLNINTGAGVEVLEQIHKPQNALLHQKTQERLLGEVVPMIAELIEEGNKSGLFNSRYPLEAAEMVIVYSNMAFDELAELSPEQMQEKIMAFIYHTEKILGAKEKSMEGAILKIISNR